MRPIDAIGLKQALVVSAILEDKKTIEQIIDEQPTIEPERKTGRWIVQKDASGKTYGECSACHYKQYAGMLKYCPECGAKMEVEHEN